MENENEFDLPILIDGSEIVVKITLMPYGYTHRFILFIGDTEIIYEPDEERNYRVMVNATESHKLTDKDRTLIHLVAAQLQQL